MNTLKRLRIRLDDRTHNAALNLNEHDNRQATACALHHKAPRGAWMAFAGAAVGALASNRRTAAGPLAILAAAVGVAQAVLGRAHDIAVAYPGHPCPNCPQPDSDDEGRGGGGVWLDAGWDDIPPAPAPMDDIDDERIREWAGDIDAQMTALIEEVSL